MRLRRTLALVAIAAGITAAAADAADRTLGAFRDWSAMTFGDGDNVTCMAFSQPVKSEGDFAKRGDAFVFVTHRPAAGQRARVSLETGYPFGAEAPATIVIDAARYPLRTSGSTAWLAEPGREGELVAAMKAGRAMLVEGTSEGGTRTRDEYSLLGFTAAVNAIDGACPAP